MRIRILLFFSIVTLSSCAQEVKTPEAWSEQNLVVLDKEGSYDFTVLGEIIGDKRIIALGESSHGIGDFYTLKSELIQYLHEEKGFEVLAMEGGLGDINLVYSNIDTMSTKQLQDNTLFSNFRTKEIQPLLNYILQTKDTNAPLRYTGFDTQTSTSYFLNAIAKALKPFDAELSAQIQPVLGAQYNIMNALRANDSLGYDNERDLFMNTSNKAQAILLKNKTEIQKQFDVSPFQFKVFERGLVMLQKSADLPFNESWRLIELRDELMAENLVWLLEEVFPNKKVIIWAHNGHVEKGGNISNSFNMMGHRLKESYGEDYYALGLFAYKGEAYQHWTQKSTPFENSENTFIEKKLSNSNTRSSFLNLNTIKKSASTKWLFETVNALEYENGGKVSFVPMNRFDGLITLYEVLPPHFDKK